MIDYLILISLIVVVLIQLNIMYKLKFFKKIYDYYSRNRDITKTKASFRPDPGDDSGCPTEDELK